MFLVCSLLRPQGSATLLLVALALASGASVWGGGYRTGTESPASGWLWVDGTSADNLNCQPLGCPNGNLWASIQPEYVRCCTLSCGEGGVLG